MSSLVPISNEVAPSHDLHMLFFFFFFTSLLNAFFSVSCYHRLSRLSRFSILYFIDASLPPSWLPLAQNGVEIEQDLSFNFSLILCRWESPWEGEEVDDSILEEKYVKDGGEGHRWWSKTKIEEGWSYNFSKSKVFNDFFFNFFRWKCTLIKPFELEFNLITLDSSRILVNPCCGSNSNPKDLWNLHI